MNLLFQHRVSKFSLLSALDWIKWESSYQRFTLCYENFILRIERFFQNSTITGNSWRYSIAPAVTLQTYKFDIHFVLSDLFMSYILPGSYATHDKIEEKLGTSKYVQFSKALYWNEIYCQFFCWEKKQQT